MTILESVIYIGENAFQHCPRVRAYNVSNMNTNYSSQDGVLFNIDKTELIKYPSGNDRISYAVPSSVTKIQINAFDYIESVSEIV